MSYDDPRRQNVDSWPIRCSDCGEELDAHADACPRCGSRNRSVHVAITGSLEALEQISLKKKRPGEREPFQEIKAGDEIYRETGERRRVERVIDRERDRYYERIEDLSGDVIRHVDEPLSQHRGHGYAKKKRHPGQGSDRPTGHGPSGGTEPSGERGTR